MWIPTDNFIRKTNLYKVMQKHNFNRYEDFYQWSITERKNFWDITIKTLNIKLKYPYSTVLDATDLEKPLWLKGAMLNIVDSCFNANPEDTAIILPKKQASLKL